MNILAMNVLRVLLAAACAAPAAAQERQQEQQEDRQQDMQAERQQDRQQGGQQGGQRTASDCGPAPRCDAGPECRLNLNDGQGGAGGKAHPVDDYRNCLLRRKQAAADCELNKTNYSVCMGDKNQQEAYQANKQKPRNSQRSKERSDE